MSKIGLAAALLIKRAAVLTASPTLLPGLQQTGPVDEDHRQGGKNVEHLREVGGEDVEQRRRPGLSERRVGRNQRRETFNEVRSLAQVANQGSVP
ncbi:hypothetical protein NKDENANG_02168 [Candidatus Entotheonellaceae bacterium PAL068K]